MPLAVARGSVVRIPSTYSNAPCVPLALAVNPRYGREHGPEGLKEFVNVKSIKIPAAA